jgi:hypothetical protein
MELSRGSNDSALPVQRQNRFPRRRRRGVGNMQLFTGCRVGCCLQEGALQSRNDSASHSEEERGEEKASVGRLTARLEHRGSHRVEMRERRQVTMVFIRT